jgi:2-amino-4-hydroxy-6-hydroxymethyldihydropteridine diphosphokinase
MPDVYVGLGSNAEPMAHLVRAVAGLQLMFAPLACSAVYRSAPLGHAGEDYLNMVVSFATDLGVEALRTELTRLEAQEGRDRSRPIRCTLDLDLLIYGRRVDAERHLPRDDVARRSFVLAPLAEIAPALTHPVTGEPIVALWRRLGASRPALTRIGPLPG